MVPQMMPVQAAVLTCSALITYGYGLGMLVLLFLFKVLTPNLDVALGVFLVLSLPSIVVNALIKIYGKNFTLWGRYTGKIYTHNLEPIGKISDLLRDSTAILILAFIASLITYLFSRK